MVAAACRPPRPTEIAVSGSDAHLEIEQLVRSYARSIDEADVDRAAQVWSTTDDVSFIHPKGDERGWQAVKEQFYRGLMQEKFSSRHLRVYDLDVQIQGDLALALFYWEVNATWRDNGAHQRTEGRETQVFRRVGDRWLLVHIHYSNMPVKAEREGF